MVKEDATKAGVDGKGAGAEAMVMAVDEEDEEDFLADFLRLNFGVGVVEEDASPRSSSFKLVSSEKEKRVRTGIVSEPTPTNSTTRRISDQEIKIKHNCKQINIHTQKGIARTEMPFVAEKVEHDDGEQRSSRSGDHDGGMFPSEDARTRTRRNRIGKDRL